MNDFVSGPQKAEPSKEGLPSLHECSMQWQLPFNYYLCLDMLTLSLVQADLAAALSAQALLAEATMMELSVSLSSVRGRAALVLLLLMCN